MEIYNLVGGSLLESEELTSPDPPARLRNRRGSESRVSWRGNEK